MIRRAGSKEAIRTEAAAWVARLADAHSSADRRQFEQWIAQDAAHQAAYDRASAAYQAAGVLRGGGIVRSRNLESAFRTRRVTIARGLAAASLAAFLLVIALRFSSGFNPFRPVALASVMLSTGTQPRDVTLADGSRISMAPASEVRIELNRTERLAQVRKGRVRLAVSRESRPFVIVAGTSRVEANAGVFDARIRGGTGTIVPAPTEKSQSGDADREGSTGTGGGNQRANNMQQTLEFNAEPLGQAVAQINRLNAGPPIELDRDLTSLRVTGVFQQGGSASVARSLAVAFGLELIETPAGMLRLTRKNN